MFVTFSIRIENGAFRFEIFPHRPLIAVSSRSNICERVFDSEGVESFFNIPWYL